MNHMSVLLAIVGGMALGQSVTLFTINNLQGTTQRSARFWIPAVEAVFASGLLLSSLWVSA